MFVDTSGWGHVIDPSQPCHQLATALATSATKQGKIVTTSLILTELAALLTSALRVPKTTQVRLLSDLRGDPAIEIVQVDAILDAAAWSLWESRPDKDWSVVDCASFVVMRSRGLTEAITTDRHFEQAGFARLPK